MRQAVVDSERLVMFVGELIRQGPWRQGRRIFWPRRMPRSPILASGTVVGRLTKSRSPGSRAITASIISALRRRLRSVDPCWGAVWRLHA